MLSEHILEELTRRHSRLSAVLTEALWPDLAVETKLQLIWAQQAQHLTVPEWLVDLALEDKSPVVQYFTLRSSALFRKEDIVAEVYGVSDEQDARGRKADAAEHPLAQAALARYSWNFSEHMRALPQLARLAVVRNEHGINLSTVVDFLGSAFNDVDDGELAYVAHEFFMRPDVQRELKRTKYTWDGLAQYLDGRSMLEAWDLVRKAGPQLTCVLVLNLPTSLGASSIAAGELATLPERALRLLACQRDDTAEIRQLHELMRRQPDHFPKLAVGCVSRPEPKLEDYVPDRSEEYRRDRLFASPCGTRTTLETVLEVQQQVTTLAEQLKQLCERPERRGLFG